jgi:hypothetical protein
MIRVALCLDHGKIRVSASGMKWVTVSSVEERFVGGTMVSQNDTYDVRRQLFRCRGLLSVSRRDWVKPASSRLVRFLEKAQRKILERVVAGRQNRLFLWNFATGWTERTLRLNDDRQAISSSPSLLPSTILSFGSKICLLCSDCCINHTTKQGVKKFTVGLSSTQEATFQRLPSTPEATFPSLSLRGHCFS